MPAGDSTYCGICQRSVAYPHFSHEYPNVNAAAPAGIGFQWKEGSTAIAPGFAWNGPVCHVCGQGYLGQHTCDLVPISCPDKMPGCLVAHYAHRSVDVQRTDAEGNPL